MVSIKESDAYPKSPLYLTTVYSDMDTTVGKWVQAQFGNDTLVMPKREFIPPSMSQEEYGKMVVEMMDESKTVAKIAALRFLGHEVQVTGEGARVEKLLPGTTAEGLLREGDVVTAAEGQPIHTATDLTNLVRRQHPGTVLTLTVQRVDGASETRVGTRESDTEPGIAVIGVLIRTYGFGHNLPIRIDIDSENIGGPSAGLMFTLGIVDAFQKEGLTAGHKIAGTGTISLDGTVGPVGGVAQKVIGAERAGAEYFLAPKENYDQAKRASRRLQVIQVDTLETAVNFLKTLRPPTLGSATSPRPLVAAA